MKHQRIGLGIAFGFALGIAAPALAQQAVQWRVEDGGNGHWYQRRSSFLATWDECRSFAESIGGHLVTITTSQEQAVVASLVAESGGNHWIGGFESDLHDWRWVTSEPWMFENGMYDDCAGGGACIPCDGENRQDYLVIEPSGMWNDSNNPGVPACACCPDTNWLGAIVEWSADCNSDGIVDYGQCRDGSLPDYDGDNVPDCCEAGTPCTVGSYPMQWRVEDGGNGHWYAKVAASPLPTTIAAMQGFAAGRGADLASITSSGENATILSLLGAIGAGESHSAWIGLYRPMPGDPWRWTDGSATTWGGWGSASCVSGPYPNDMPFPGELGTVIYRQNCGLVWDDSATAWIQNPPPWWGGVANMTLVLEWSADCDADGVVDYGQILQGQLVDADSNGVPDVCEVDPCPGDITGNGVVDGVDLSLILALWGTSGQKFPRSDANNDGIVDANDLAIVLSGWGPCPN